MRRRGEGPILVRLPNWLGDLILAWPVVEAAAASNAVFAGPPAFADLVRARAPQARYVAVDRGRPFAAVRAIRALAPARALLLTDSLSSALVAALAGIPERIGHSAEGRGLLLTRRVPRAGPARSTSRVREYRALGEAAGLDAAAAAPALRATPEEAARGAALLLGAGIAGAPYAVLAPGAAYGPAKQWGPARFASAGAHLARRRGASLAIVGGAADREAGAETAAELARSGAHAVDLTGRTDLTELAGILAGAAAVISNDSGVMHLAAALGRPTVGVFGSTSPVWTAASAPHVANLYAAYPCSPCFRRTCPIGYGCLRSIGAEQAVAALDRLLA